MYTPTQAIYPLKKGEKIIKKRPEKPSVYFNLSQEELSLYIYNEWKTTSRSIDISLANISISRARTYVYIRVCKCIVIIECYICTYIHRLVPNLNYM